MAMELLSKPRTEEELLALESEVCSYGDTAHYVEKPKFFESCKGSYLYDRDEQPFLDLQMWYSTVNLGYGHPQINQALQDQMERLPQLACQYLHKEKIELAHSIVESVKKGFKGAKGRVHFNVGGAQANEDALKLVRKSTKRQRMLAFEGSYHGRTLGATAITASPRYREPFGEFADRAEFVPFPYCFRCPYGKKPDNCGMACIQQLERKFEHECTGAWNPATKQSEFAAFFVEPVQGTGGYIVPPQGYFKRLGEICRDHGILLVDDEVQMGVFRTGKLWAMEHFDTIPDVMTFAKSITNGLNPLSGMWASEDYISPDKFGPGSTHSTYSSNTIGTATGLAVMNVLTQGNYEETVPQKGAYFLNILKDLQTKHPEIGDVDGLGLALRMEMCQADGFTPNRALANAMFQRGLEGNMTVQGKKMGIVLNIGGYYKNVITFAPSLEITYEEMDLAHELLDIVLREAKQRVS